MTRLYRRGSDRQRDRAGYPQRPGPRL